MASGDPRHTQVIQRRRLAAGLAALALLVLVLGAFSSDGRDFGDKVGSPMARQASGGAAPGAPDGPELPGGGRQILPDRRVVAFYGAPQDAALGTLGIGTPAETAARLAKQSRPYEQRGDRPVLGAFELLATIAATDAGDDGKYRTRQKAGVVRRYLAAARKAGALLVLDIQPGRADFMSEVKVYEKFLREPDVSLALDPEWHVGPEEVPGQTIGSVSADEVNRVAAYLSGIVEEGNLPQKLLVVHQFTEDMITKRERLQEHPGVALTLNVDGFGSREQKLAKYDAFTGGDSSKRAVEAGAEGAPGSKLTTPPASERPPGAVEPEPQPQSDPQKPSTDESKSPAAPEWVHHGFKLFYEEDTDLLLPRDVLGLRPQPEFVVYE